MLECIRGIITIRPIVNKAFSDLKKSGMHVVCSYSK